MRDLLEIESVRLIHSNGSPNSYTLNQIYIPGNIEHQARGIFVLLLQDSSTANGEFVSSLSTTLIRDYYKPGTPQGIDGFERVLLHVNDVLVKDTTHPGITGCIALLFDNEIHLTFIGTPQATLLRNDELIRLTEVPKTNESVPQTFSIITSGEVMENDTLVILTGILQSTQSEIEDAILFGATQKPLYETGRALARILKTQDEHQFEAICIGFNDRPTGARIIALDKSLETTEEKIARFRVKISWLISIIKPFVSNLNLKLQSLVIRKTNKPLVNSGPGAQEEPDHNQLTPTVKLDGLLSNDTIVQNNAIQADFAIKNYKQVKINQTELSPVQSPAPGWWNWFKTVESHFITQRSLYLLGAIVAILIIAIVIFNRITRPPEPIISTAERDAIINQATIAAREADTAQAQDDTNKAIQELSKIESLLSKLTPDTQNETSKALALRSQEVLNKLTNTVVLTPNPEITTSQSALSRIILTPTNQYVFGTDVIVQKINSTGLEKLPFEPVTFVDAVAMNGQKNIAILTKKDTSFQVWNLDVTNNSIKEIKRNDGKPWPESRIIASFESNIYLVGSKITKALPASDSYRVVTFQGDPATSDVTSLLTNGSVFYGLEGDKHLIRIASNTPKTGLKPFGVPEDFWPKSFTRLIESGKEGQILLFDATTKRIVIVSTDGGYKGQFILKKSDDLVDCSRLMTKLSCVTSSNTIVTFSIP